MEVNGKFSASNCPDFQLKDFKKYISKKILNLLLKMGRIYSYYGLEALGNTTLSFVQRLSHYLLYNVPQHYIIGSTDMTISNISVPNCCSAPCVLKRGTNVSVTIDFTTDKTYAEMTQQLCGRIGGGCIVLQSLPKDFCKYTTCPVVTGTKYSAVVQLPILLEWPPVRMCLVVCGGLVG